MRLLTAAGAAAGLLHLTAPGAVAANLLRGEFSPICQPAQVNVVVHTNSHGLEVLRTHELCDHGGQRLPCQIYDKDDVTPDMLASADAFLFNFAEAKPEEVQAAYAAEWARRRRGRRPKALVSLSSESSQYYPIMGDRAVQQMFDLSVSCRLDDDIVYSFKAPGKCTFTLPPVPTAHKKHAVAFLNSNCAGTPSGRTEIVQGLMHAGVRVDAWGLCLHNMGLNRDHCTRFNKLGVCEDVDKLELFREYKFCIAMENSVMRDYVTEKLWDALEAGCVPIYYGAPNVALDFLPVPEAALVYDPKTTTLEQFAEEIKRLMADDVAYDAMVQWRKLPLEHLSSGYRRICDIANGPSHVCQICTAVARMRDAAAGRPVCS